MRDRTVMKTASESWDSWKEGTTARNATRNARDGEAPGLSTAPAHCSPKPLTDNLPGSQLSEAAGN